jgi:hypothetical protein
VLHVGDPPALWRELGFVVDDDGRCVVGAVPLNLGGAEPGLAGWPDDSLSDDGPSEHPNGIVALDHLVLSTSDLDRTVTELESERGLELRRVRDAGRVRQAFFRLPGTILEVVGPGPDRWYGLAFTSGDLDATAAYLGDRLRPPKDAVQPGRRIATLDRSVGSTVAIAVMSPR